jgi:ATP-binding cassette subfamily B protein
MKSIEVKQHDMMDCGAACISSVGNFHKIFVPITKIRQWSETDKNGANVLGLIDALDKMGFHAKGVKASIEAIDKIPLPSIAHMIYENRLQHFVVIYKVKKKSLTIMDPSLGHLIQIGIKEFEASWSSALILIAPKSNFSPSNFKKSNISRFYSLIKPHKSILFQSIFGALLYTILGLSIPIYIQKITDHVLINGNKNLLNLMSSLMILLISIQAIIGAKKTVLVMKTGQLIDAQLILGYYTHIMNLPQRFFDTMRIGEIISRINDAIKIRNFINETALEILVNSLVIVFTVTLMFTYYWKLALIISFIIPIYTGIYFSMNYLNKRNERKIMEVSAKLETQLVESINHAKTIKEFGIEEFSNSQIEHRFVKLLFTGFKSGLNSLFASASSQYLSSILTIIILWFGSYYVIDGMVSPGELFSFYALIGFFTGPVTMLIGANKSIQNALIASDRLFEIMDLEIESTNQSKLTLQKSDLGDIQFQHVTFSYGNKAKLFVDFNLTIYKNQVTALVGESGCGKTTIFSLFQQLYPIREGSVFIGHYNMNDINVKDLRSMVGVISQDLQLFSGNIIENIALGDPNPDIKRILDICSKLEINEFIERLPNSYNTEIGENGTLLSGGQKQRIAFARAIYKKPEILLLDEATSSLDSNSELPIKKFIESYKKQFKTIVIIAHRLSTIKSVDRIVFLKRGQVQEVGTHQELINLKGDYNSLWQLQHQDLMI